MAHPALAGFLDRMDAIVAMTNDPHEVADRTAVRLAELLSHPDFLEERHRRPGVDDYRQHVVHVHPEGLYSIVALVWTPGQGTPVHDHRCWCVVGVLEGQEREERYRLHADGGDEWLSHRSVTRHGPGSTSALVPPDEDIHRVVSDADGTTISIHVYGADIAACGTSVNRVFDLALRETDTRAVVSWRERDDELAGHPDS